MVLSKARESWLILATRGTGFLGQALEMRQAALVADLCQGDRYMGAHEGDRVLNQLGQVRHPPGVADVCVKAVETICL